MEVCCAPSPFLDTCAGYTSPRHHHPPRLSGERSDLVAGVRKLQAAQADADDKAGRLEAAVRTFQQHADGEVGALEARLQSLRAALEEVQAENDRLTEPAPNTLNIRESITLGELLDVGNPTQLYSDMVKFDKGMQGTIVYRGVENATGRAVAIKVGRPRWRQERLCGLGLALVGGANVAWCEGRGIGGLNLAALFPRSLSCAGD